MLKVSERRLARGLAVLVGLSLAASLPAGGLYASPQSSATPAAESIQEPFEPRGLRLLVEAVGDRRVVEGRLAGGFGWGPWEGEGAKEAAGSEDLDYLTRLAAAARRIEEEAEAHPSPQTRQAMGLLHLVQQHWDDAVAELRAAADATPEGEPKAAILSDLAAAYLARGRAEGRPAEWIEALTAAAVAVRLDAGSSEARFNQALACSRLHLSRSGRSSWNAYLRLDASAPWAADARRHLEALDAPTLAERWRQRHEPLVAAALAGDADTVREIAGELPLFVRGFAENMVLPAWGAALGAEDGEEAARQLAVARAIGEALVALGLDRSVAEAVASIDEAGPRGERLGALARGHAAYGEGYGIEKGWVEGSACEAYRAAREALSSAAGSFTPWASFNETVACLYHRDNEAAHRAFTALAGEVSPERNPALAGRIDWMLLLTEMRRGRFEAAYRHGLSAYELLRRARDVDAASVDVRLAFVAHALGLEAEAWGHRQRALEAFAGFGHAAGLHGVLDEGAGLLLDEGRDEGAAVLVEELVANAEALRPEHRAYAYGERARLAARRGDASGAGRDLARAEAEAAQLAPSDVRRRVEEDLAYTRGRIEVATDPQKAVGTLTGSLEGYTAVGDLFQAPRLHLLRARAHLALGLASEAERDFEEAFRQVEARRAHSTSEQHRVSFFETIQDTADELIAFFTGERDDPARAFAYAEAARGRALLDWVRRFGPSNGSMPPLDAGYPAEASLADLERALPPELALIQYAVLPGRLLAWVCRRGSCRMQSLPVPAEALEARVRRFHAAMERRAGEADLRPAGERLFADLIAPLAEGLGEAEGLVIVPDRFLHLLPFAALRDRKRGEYLIERWSLRLAPSASVFLSALERVRPVPERRGVLVLADPDLAPEDAADLGALPLAPEEARKVAALYPRHELLLGAQASKARLFEEVVRFPVLHVASHARHRPEAPLMSALPLSDGGVAGAGTLYAHELYGRAWSQVELVVLSACRTAGTVSGSGREGPAGLLRAFLAAGVPRVVAAAWDVPDRAALELMVRFHEGLAAGEGPAEALQKAQVEMLRHEEERFRTPAVWANFQLYGA